MDQGGDKKTYYKKCWKKKSDTSVSRKVTQRITFQKAIIKRQEKQHRTSNENKSRASISGNSIKYDIGRLKIQIKKTFNTLEANIDKLGVQYSDLTSYDREYISGNSHLQFHNKPKSFTGTKRFKPDPEYSVKIPGVTIPTCVMLHRHFRSGT